MFKSVFRRPDECLSDPSTDTLCATDITTTRKYIPTAGPLDRETRPSGGVTQYAYDARGRLDTISRGNAANDLKERIKYTYDANNGKKSSESWQAYESAAWVEKKREAYSYDSDAQLASITHADNTSVVYTYDVNGRVWKVRDENHASPNTTYAYDPAGRLKSVSQTLGAGSVITAYAYDVQGNLTSVTDPNGNVTSYVYDDFGRMLKQTSPVTGVTMYVYDEAGNLKATTDANNVLTTRTYDALNRLKTEDADPQVGPIAGDPYHIEWGWGDGVGNGGGRLGGFIDNAGVTNYLYDRRGLLVSDERFMKDQEWYTTRYGYDSDGNRTLIEYPFNQIIRDVAYTYDYAGRPLSAVLLHSGVLAQGAKYLPFGPLVELTYGNGTVKTSAYDNRYRMSENRLTSGATPLARYSYEYDSAGNITNIHDLLDAGYDRTFGYDDLSRLVTANTGASLWGPGAYSYDAMGNMQSLSLGASGAPQGRQSAFHYQATTPRLTSVEDNGVQTPVTYDSVGNETEYLASREYTSNRMTFVTRPSPAPGESLSVAYEYDARGLRVTRNEYWSDSHETRHFIYSPELKLLAVHHADPQGNGGLLRQQTNSAPTGDYWLYGIVWFGDLPVAQLEGGITPSFTFTDHLGTPILQTSNNLPVTVSWRAEYEPFGSIWKQHAGAGGVQPLRFPGQESAMTWEGAEENYNIFRWYRSGWGRYTQSDPIGLAGGSNLYAYVGGNPIGRVDSFGLVPVDYIGQQNKDILATCGGPFTLGCTKVDVGEATCTCSAGCDRRTKRNVWVASAKLHINRIRLFFSTDCYDTGKIIMEEERHVATYQSGIENAMERTRKMNGQSFSSKSKCEDECRDWFAGVKRDIGQPLTTSWIDFTHPTRRCNGSVPIF